MATIRAPYLSSFKRASSLSLSSTTSFSASLRTPSLVPPSPLTSAQSPPTCLTGRLASHRASSCGSRTDINTSLCSMYAVQRSRTLMTSCRYSNSALPAKYTNNMVSINCRSWKKNNNIMTCYGKFDHLQFFRKTEFLAWIDSSVCVESNGASFIKKY